MKSLPVQQVPEPKRCRWETRWSPVGPPQAKGSTHNLPAPPARIYPPATAEQCLPPHATPHCKVQQNKRGPTSPLGNRISSGLNINPHRYGTGSTGGLQTRCPEAQKIHSKNFIGKQDKPSMALLVLFSVPSQSDIWQTQDSYCNGTSLEEARTGSSQTAFCFWAEHDFFLTHVLL